MRLSGALLWLIARLVPASTRQRWLEEWRAELAHARWTMVFGAPKDAWALRSSVSDPRRRPRPFHAFPQDVRYAIRGLLAAPGFVLGTVLSLSVGIGANVVAFSFINGAVFRPFSGVDKQHELVRVSIAVQAQHFTEQFEYTHFNLDIARQRLTTLRGVSGFWPSRLAVSTGEQAWSTAGGLVSSNYFDVLGVLPAAGRFFVSADDAPGAAVAVISDGAWDRLFARDPAAVGKAISVNGATLEVIGITPPGFAGVRRDSDRPTIWIPLGQASPTLRDADGRPATLSAAHGGWPDYIGRRREGVSLAQVQTEAAVLARQIGLDSGKNAAGNVSRVWLNDPVTSAPSILAFMVIPMLVLAIACVNAANLMLARAARQARDWTVRLALGASRWRVIRQVLTEATLLAMSAAALGLALGRWAVQLAGSQVPIPIPVDRTVVFFTIAIALFTAVAFSLGPALKVTSQAKRRMTAAPSGAGASRSRVRFALVALQAALSLGLLTTGATFTKTVFAANPRAAKIPDPQLLVLTNIDLDPLRFTAAAGDDFYTRLLVRLRQVPGVTDAGFSTPGLVRGGIADVAPVRLWLPDTPAKGIGGFFAMHVSPGALQTIGMPMLQGRHFTGQEAGHLRTVVVNEPFARKFFDGAAIGRTFRVGSALESGADVIVIGVTDGIMKVGGQEPALLYHAAPISYQPARALYIRIQAGGAFKIEALHVAVREIDPRVPLGTPVMLSDATG